MEGQILAQQIVDVCGNFAVLTANGLRPLPISAPGKRGDQLAGLLQKDSPVKFILSSLHGVGTALRNACFVTAAPTGSAATSAAREPLTTAPSPRGHSQSTSTATYQ